MELNLPASKTHPFRHGIRLIIASSNDAGYPVRAMKQLIQTDTHRPPHAPLFYIRRNEQHPFTREHVVRRLQELAIVGGLGSGAWNGHSVRRGAATWAAEVGLSESQIQTLVRWKSDAYKTYIEYPIDERIALSRRLQRPPTTRLQYQL